MMKTGSISLFDSPYPSTSTNDARRHYRPSYARNEYLNPLLFQRTCLRSPHTSQGRFPFLFSHHAAHFRIPRMFRLQEQLCCWQKTAGYRWICCQLGEGTAGREHGGARGAGERGMV
ncbi:hypothetical protein M408DRAFT_266148 [Serendipita vermifera MAFF 305830]|uniref:Uncharacterized protein n=1 Tax=Serendipita vermifera MAFF 305830 TaxID=933852 RepID=A0A0C3AV76_SERVB|nr:hypothetical protein M408DRAFT_266148 [Serendipita vermifera MAFF 305830]